MDFPVDCDVRIEVAFSILAKAVCAFSIWSVKLDTDSVVVSTDSPALEEMIPNEDNTFTSLDTCPLDVSEINPHSRAAFTRELIWSSPSWMPSVSKAYLKSVSVSPRSLRASAFFLTSLPNLDESFPDKASLNLLAETTDSFNWSFTSVNWSAYWDMSEFFNNDCTALSTALNSVAACLILSESPSDKASL